MRISTRIHIPEINLWLPGHSLLMNFSIFLHVQLSTLPATAIDEAGVPRTISPNATMFHSAAGLGNVQHGIVAGTGIAPVDIENYVLAAKVLNGVGAGQLQYSAQSFQAPARLDNSTQWALTRSFTNNSGSAIIIQELGLLSSAGLAPPFFLLFREVIEPIPILNGATRTFSIVFTLSA